MGKAKHPRHGSMQFWPRKRSQRPYARVRKWVQGKDAKPLSFAGYKAGMTHVLYTDNKKTSLTKGEDIACPVTIIECPPLKVAALRFYKNSSSGSRVVSDVFAAQLDKELGRKLSLPKKQEQKNIPEVFDDLTLLVYTQPKLTGIGNKKPEFFEVGLGGKKDDKVKYAQEKLGKEIMIKDVFVDGQLIDVHGITTGKGFQGPVKRFGVALRSHKSEKVKRGPGSLGGWKGQGHVMYRVAHAGRMGYHQRIHHNQWLLKIGDKPEDINQKSGIAHYGVVKNTYVLVKGSILGPKKRIVRFHQPRRPDSKNTPKEAPSIVYVSKR